MKLIEHKINNLNFSNTRQDNKWKDYKGGQEIFKLEEMWNESGFDKNSYDAVLFLKSKLDLSKSTILDIGSGKGQSVFNLALNFKFKEIVGIELMTSYVSIFEDNLKLIRSSEEIFETSLECIENININALDYNYVHEDIYFIFNSVGEKSLKSIIEKITKRKTKLYIIYFNALHFHLFENIPNNKVIYQKICDEFDNPKIVIYEYN